MTEHDWLTSKDPQAMLEHIYSYRSVVPGKTFQAASNRKLQLLCCAIGDADGSGNWELANYPGKPEQWLAGWLSGAEGQRYELEDFALVANLLRDIIGNPFQWGWRCPACTTGDLIERRDRELYCGGCDGVWPVSWLTDDVLNLAQSIYDNRTFEKMPMLGDMLEDAGCHVDDILRHCRGIAWWDCKTGCGRRHDDRCSLTGASGWYATGAPRVRGDWVIDLLLGKE